MESVGIVVMSHQSVLLMFRQLCCGGCDRHDLLFRVCVVCADCDTKKEEASQPSCFTHTNKKTTQQYKPTSIYQTSKQANYDYKGTNNNNNNKKLINKQ